MENSFVQIANRINGNTNMIIHAMISSDLERWLSTGHFQNVRTVFVWGKHGKEAIEFRQKQLGGRCPEIRVEPALFGSPSAARIDKAGAKKVLFAADGYSSKYIDRITRLVPEKVNLTVRVHPGDKRLLSRLRSRKPNVTFDNLEGPIENHFSDTQVFIGYYSTAIIDAIHHGIPTVILNLKDLVRKHPSVFLEAPLAEKERSVMFAGTLKDLVVKIQRIVSDDGFRKRVLSVNRKLMSCFVAPER